MSLARPSVAFEPSPADPSFFEKERERLVEEIGNVSHMTPDLTDTPRSVSLGIRLIVVIVIRRVDVAYECTQ